MSYLSPVSGSGYFGYPGNEAVRGALSGDKDARSILPEDETARGRLPGDEEKKDSKGKSNGVEDPSEECQTCKRRKYVDGSDEMVSFKSPTHIAPESAGAAVRSHEQEHVTNAYSKAALGGGKVIRASVTIHMAICPECGRSYVSGGTTNTQIKYYNEDNPYQQDLKETDGIKYRGMNADYAV